MGQVALNLVQNLLTKNRCSCLQMIDVSNEANKSKALNDHGLCLLNLYLMEEFQRADEQVDRYSSYKEEGSTYFFKPFVYFISAMNCLAMARSNRSNASKKRQFVQKAQTYRKKLSAYVREEGCAPDCVVWKDLIEAQVMAVVGKNTTAAEERYHHAIAGATQLKQWLVVAIAWECCTEYLVDTNASKKVIQNALKVTCQAYFDYGAYKKLDLLKERFSSELSCHWSMSSPSDALQKRSRSPFLISDDSEHDDFHMDKAEYSIEKPNH